MIGRVAAGLAALLLASSWAMTLPAQEVSKDAPPALEDFETDGDGDGVPDRWYNLRDASLAGADGPVGAKFLHFENARPGRHARASRAFTVSGKETEALIVGLWVRVAGAHPGERSDEDPGLQIDFFSEKLVATGRERVGPFADRAGRGWMRVARRVNVTPETQVAILTLGLLGAVGKLDVDGLTIDLVPRGGAPTTNLVLNGDCELGVDAPASWALEGGARRAYPGHRSATGVELPSTLDKALIALAVRPDRARDLDVSLAAKAAGLRGAGGARATLYFLDGDGRPLAAPDESAPLWRWGGTSAWKVEHARVRLPAGASRAVLQVERLDGRGKLTIDDVMVVDASDPAASRWTPYHVTPDTDDWRPFEGSAKVEPKSALDASNLLEAPAGKKGAVVVRDGRLHFGDGSRARFFGVAFLPPLAFPEAALADALADRLARSGVNLVRFDGFDVALGPNRSLYEDGRDDTQALDPGTLAKFDHLVAALKARGIYVALELQSLRRFREDDKVPGWLGLPPGGGPAIAFDPTIRKLLLKTAEALLDHKNPETGLKLRDDPALAWVTLAGELSLFNLIDDPDVLPPESASELKALMQKGGIGSGRAAWRHLEAAQWKSIADDLRKLGLKRPIAGSSHWRRESEFCGAQAAAGLDLIDDRLYWAPPRFGLPERRSMLWRPSAGLSQEAAKKRKADRPYVVSDYAALTSGAWALPYEGADLVLAARTAAAEDWDALVRRGVFLHPQSWGRSAPGTTGVQDLFPMPESLNAIVPAFSLLPHAASLLLRPQESGKPAASASKRPGRGSWDPRAGLLVVDTPYTQGLAGWSSRKPGLFETLTVEVESPHAVVLVSSVGPAPIAESRRLLVTAVGRSEPTGILYADQYRREVADPGRVPMLVEPVRARVSWKAKGKVRAYALDATGARAREVKLEAAAGAVRLEIDGSTPTLHWELVES